MSNTGKDGNMLRLLGGQFKIVFNPFLMQKINTGFKSVDRLADKATSGKIGRIIQWGADKLGLSEVRHANEEAIKVGFFI